MTLLNTGAIICYWMAGGLVGWGLRGLQFFNRVEKEYQKSLTEFINVNNQYIERLKNELHNTTTGNEGRQTILED